MIMLETTHTRDYYLSIAERYPLFEAVITGDDSLVCWLDTIAEGYSTREETAVRLEALCELYSGDDLSDENLPDLSVGEFLAITAGYIAVGITPLYYAGVAALILIPPPFGVVAGVALSCVAAPLSGIVVGRRGLGRQMDRLVEKRKKALQPLYSIADSLDADISRCFILKDFHEACGRRERFEQTYRSLEPEERKAVDAQLHSYLAAGGIPGTDERQLNDYLGGLTERGMAPDA